MSLHKPLEGLLRPPLEWYSASLAITASLLLLSYPFAFLLPLSLAYSIACLVFAFGLLRFKQGYRIFRYHRNLKRMPAYQITSKQIPVSQHKLFLGKGFRWTPQHTQRLRDLDLPYNLHYKTPSHLKRWARQKELQWEQGSPYFRSLAKLLAKDTRWNPFRPYPDIGGEPCIHGVSEKEEN